ncbi:LysR family transcriptional regulator [Entomomonas asaccharolytica]|uniref:LysR family transcriptional regulator n=1 Tax=Entomomonas asaccharolytica TaxID=2785331 RepID=A0A974NDZ1_9GAMM|nr:LysR family transcriptional regulator [Entomomonas asaccharolytica]QQP84839.1 LysR family transcriptional regulator [Entomomonas asaccharolytica]
MPLSLRQVRYFVAAAEIGQVSQAAMYLNISQSSVTTAIQELERLLNAQLFVRTPQGMVLTDSGRHFLNHAYAILGAVEDALNDPAPANSLTGSLNIAASFTIMGYVLPYHIKRLSLAYPNLKIKLHECSHHQIEEGLLSGKFDMSLVSVSNIASDKIVVENLLNSPRHLWLPAKHPLAEKDSISFADIADEPYILLSIDEAEKVGELYWKQHNHPLNVCLTTISIEAVRNMVANECGITILSDMVYRPWSLEGKRIVTKNLVTPAPSLSIGLAWSEDMEMTPSRRCFQEYFRRTYLTPQVVASRY